MSDKVKFAIVGAGAISQSYAQAFEKSDTAQLVAVADTRPDAAKALAAGFSCPSYDCYKKLAENTDVEGVILCTPPVTHPGDHAVFSEPRHTRVV